MINIKLGVFCVIVLISFISLVGCENKEFVKDYTEYKKLYVEVVNEFVPNDSDYELEKLNEPPIMEKLEQMDKIVKKMSNNASTKREKQMLSNALQLNEGLQFLKYAANNKDNLTLDERRKRSGEVLSAKMNRKDIEEGDLL